MNLKIKINILLLIILLGGSLYYSTFLLNKNPINYDWPKEIEFRPYGSMIDDLNLECVRAMCYKIPFPVETRQIASIEAVRMESDTFEFSSKSFVETSETITLTGSRFMKKSFLVEVPEISVNNEIQKMTLSNGYYEVPPIVIQKEIHPNIFEIKNLIIKRTMYPMSEVIVPFLFKKQNYAKSINTPQHLILLQENGKTGELIYDVKIPEFYRIDYSTSGFQKIAFVAHQLDLGQIGGPEGIKMNFGDLNNTVRIGTAEQKIQMSPRGDFVTFSTVISLDNPFAGFEVTFIPSRKFIIFIMFLLSIGPLINFVVSKINNWDKLWIKIISSYGVIFAFLGINTLDGLVNSLQFISKFRYFVHPLLITLLFLVPTFYLVIVNSKRRTFKIKTKKFTISFI